MSSQEQPRIAIRPFHIIAVLIVAALLATSVTSAQQNPMANRLTLDLYTRVEGVGSRASHPTEPPSYIREASSICRTMVAGASCG